jgi:D-arabinose 1-dehydrogenase-like Zn-dependent alcohol dehydrogenase
LGHYAVMLLKKLGYSVAAFTHSEDKVAKISVLGCDEIVMYTDKEKLKKYEEKFDFIIDTLPTVDYFQETFKMLEKEGKYVMVGIPPFNQELKIDFKKLIFGDNIFIGSLNGNRSQTNELIQYSSKHNIYPVIEEFSFDDFPRL